MQLLTINIKTSKSEIREMCELYWDLANDYSFTFKIDEIAKTFDVKKAEVTTIVRENSSAIFNEFRCKLCDKPLATFKIRNELILFFNGFSGYINTTSRICNNCLAENDQEELTRLKQSFDKSIFETLSDLEFQFLIALAKNDNLDTARQKIGISYQQAVLYFDNFISKGIIGQNKTLGFFFLPEFKAKLEKIGQRPKVKSIFFSKKVQDFYRRLKSEYLFVFPEVPLCTFVEKDDVKHLFNTPGEWLGPYFFTCRLDFVICDENGLPKFAVEYQGGYHTDTEKIIKRDLFKEQVLETVGLKLFQCPRDNELVFLSNDTDNYKPIYSKEIDKLQRLLASVLTKQNRTPDE